MGGCKLLPKAAMGAIKREQQTEAAECGVESSCHSSLWWGNHWISSGMWEIMLISFDNLLCKNSTCCQKSLFTPFVLGSNSSPDLEWFLTKWYAFALKKQTQCMHAEALHWKWTIHGQHIFDTLNEGCPHAGESGEISGVHTLTCRPCGAWGFAKGWVCPVFKYCLWRPN